MAEHPARLAGRRSQEAAMRGKKQDWLDLYADDCVVEDPVGPSPFDPTGAGRRGKAALAAFWDQAIEGARITMEYPTSYACGDECAFVGRTTNELPDGTRISVEGVSVYRVDAEGRIVSLRAYWELPPELSALAAGHGERR
jgi:ketosteroid isomerase-like protein